MFLIRRKSHFLIDPPKPELELDEYTVNRLEKGLLAIRNRLKTNLLQPARDFLQRHELAYAQALDALQSEHEETYKKLFIYKVQFLDEEFHRKPFLYKNFNEQELMMHRAILKFREKMLFANWGNYDAQRVEGYFLRTSQEATKVKAVRPFATSDLLWKGIARILGIESDNIGSWSKSGPFGVENKVISRVKEVCANFGFSYEHMERALIATVRFSFVPNMIALDIDRGAWNRLGHQIHHDLKECSTLFPEHWIPAFRRNMEDLRGTYLRVIDSRDPETWMPTDQAMNLTYQSSVRRTHRGNRPGDRSEA